MPKYIKKNRCLFSRKHGNGYSVALLLLLALLLAGCEPAQDPGPDQVLKFDQAVKLSRSAAGTGHPAILVMDPANTSDTQSPAAFQDDSQNWALQMDTQLDEGGKTKTLTLAVVLGGKYQG